MDVASEWAEGRAIEPPILHFLIGVGWAVIESEEHFAGREGVLLGIGVGMAWWRNWFCGPHALGFGILAGGQHASVKGGFQCRFNLPDGYAVEIR